MGGKSSKSRSEDKKNKGDQKSKDKKPRKLSFSSMVSKNKANTVPKLPATNSNAVEDQNVNPTPGPSNANANAKDPRDAPKIVEEHVKVRSAITSEEITKPKPSVKTSPPPLPPKATTSATSSPAPIPPHSPIQTPEGSKEAPRVESEQEAQPIVELPPDSDSEPELPPKGHKIITQDLNLTTARQEFLNAAQLNGTSSTVEQVVTASARSITSTTRTSVQTSSSIQEIKSTSFLNGNRITELRESEEDDSDNDNENDKEAENISARPKLERQTKIEKFDTSSSTTMSTFTSSVQVNRSAMQMTTSVGHPPLMIIEQASGSSEESLTSKLGPGPIKSVIVQELPGVTVSTVATKTSVTEEGE